jgi:hypothetical protein
MLSAMTEVVRWQAHRAQGRHSVSGPLPEPPRSQRVAKSAPVPTDRAGEMLEEWLTSLGVATTLDAD